jgi:hypothetical protein
MLFRSNLKFLPIQEFEIVYVYFRIKALYTSHQQRIISLTQIYLSRNATCLGFKNPLPSIHFKTFRFKLLYWVTVWYLTGQCYIKWRYGIWLASAILSDGMVFDWPVLH